MGTINTVDYYSGDGKGVKLTKKDSETKNENYLNQSTKGTSYLTALNLLNLPAAEIALSTGLKIAGASLFVVGAAVGVTMGAYLTNKYCDELIEKFTEYYKKHKNKIVLSYKEALKYFEENKNEINKK